MKEYIPDENSVLYEVVDIYGEYCELVQGPSNIQANKYGYKLMGHLYNDENNCLVFDEKQPIGKQVIKMSTEYFMNFSRERKLNNINNEVSEF
jgi:hypothetical protein